MSFNSNGNNILDWFYPFSTQKSNTPNSAQTTNFKINNVDISNNYTKLGTNSNIPVSQLYTNLGYTYNNNPIETLFELNLPVFDGSINTDFVMYPGNSGLLIQILKSTTLRFNYDLDCSFCMVGGGGGGGAGIDYVDNVGGGGGGGAGEVITGSIRKYLAGNDLIITIGDGGAGGIVTGPTEINYSGQSGKKTSLTYESYTVDASGGTGGGCAKKGSGSTIGSSTGGTGGYSTGVPTVGTATQRNISNGSIFSGMVSFNNIGSQGNDQAEDDNKDTGAGGGGGGASTAAVESETNNEPGIGGDGIEQTYGTQPFILGGGGGGGGRTYNKSPGNVGGAGGAGGGGDGGGGASSSSATNGSPGTANTGGGGGGGQNRKGISSDTGLGGKGGSGTVIFYIRTSQVRL